MGLEITAEGARQIAMRSRGTPRITNRLLRRVRDFAQVKGNGEIDEDIASKSTSICLMLMLPVLTILTEKLLFAIIDKFMGGPVGLDNLAAAIGEERETIEDVLEPYLIQQGFIQRTPRGRAATNHAYRHFNRIMEAP